MTIHIHIYINRHPAPQNAIDIYTALGWGTPKDYDLPIWQKAFDNSDFITAYDENELAGFIRLISDGFHDTQVLEFAVAPKYQRQGIGKSLLKTLKDKYGHTDIYCNTTRQTTDFFLTNGFKRNRLTGVSMSQTK